MRVERTEVGIVGGGPAGLALSHLLARAGIDSVVIDARSRAEIAATARAGILEAGNARMLVGAGVSDRVLREGDRHEGIELRFDGHGHRIDFAALAGSAVWLYPQTEVFIDLADARARDGGDVRFGVRDASVDDLDGETPRVRWTEADGTEVELRCEWIVGADGAHSMTRKSVPESRRQTFFRSYPFAWFGLLVEAPRSAPELVYARSDEGFALVSQRSERVQRMYFQCDPETDAASLSDAEIWDTMQRRVAGDGWSLQEGPIIERSVLPFRSFVCEPMRFGSLMLIGDAAHTVPPTGAKGLNLALRDARILAERLIAWHADRDRTRLDGYGDAALRGIWRAQHFSYSMTSMLHVPPGGHPFDTRRQLAELEHLVTSKAASTALAEAYTGWPGEESRSLVPHP